MLHGSLLCLRCWEADLSRCAGIANLAQVILVAEFVEDEAAGLSRFVRVDQTHGPEIDVPLPVLNAERARTVDPRSDFVGSSRQRSAVECEVEWNGCPRDTILRQSATCADEGDGDEVGDCGYAFHDDLLFHVPSSGSLWASETLALPKLVTTHGDIACGLPKTNKYTAILQPGTTYLLARRYE